MWPAGLHQWLRVSRTGESNSPPGALPVRVNDSGDHTDVAYNMLVMYPVRAKDAPPPPGNGRGGGGPGPAMIFG